MSARTAITRKNGNDYFRMEQLSPGDSLADFSCSVEEYAQYLIEDALRSQNDHIALTWILWERATGEIAAYMSLIADAIKLSVSEKELHNLNYPFKTIPAMKIAKLAVSEAAKKTHKGIGTFMIDSGMIFAQICNRQLFACQFLTVDADVENNESVLNFYGKNGFIKNSEMNNKNRKTISMRKDIFA
ncbi:N-acetyltransferase [Spirochaetia bacterium]|nr:N-acetyltransferase [Spirochaetia bacterium]